MVRSLGSSKCFTKPNPYACLSTGFLKSLKRLYFFSIVLKQKSGMLIVKHLQEMEWLVKILPKSTLTRDKRLFNKPLRVNSMQKAFNFKAS